MSQQLCWINSEDNVLEWSRFWEEMEVRIFDLFKMVINIRACGGRGGGVSGSEGTTKNVTSG